MSSSKKDRMMAPRVGSRPSRAKHVGDRNVKPPAGYRPAGKRKPGEAVMEAQLAVIDVDPGPEVPSEEGIGGGPSRQLSTAAVSAPDPDLAAGTAAEDVPPPADPWWTPERERAFAMTLQGVPQHQVAAELGRDRHTVARWVEDERFAERLFAENASRFKASRQRRSIQTVRLTDKADHLANKMIDKAIKLAEEGKDDLSTRLAARDWLQEFRENSRREDEIFGLAQQRVDVNVNGQVRHDHKHKVGVTFKAFLAASVQAMGIDPETEEIDGERSDEALIQLTERALTGGSFLDDLVEHEREEKLAPMLSGERR